MRILLFFGRFVPVFDKLKLYEILWFLGREVNDGCGVLALAASGKGIESARQRGEEMFARTHDSRIAATMGWIEVQHNRDLAAAGNWVHRSHQFGCEDGSEILALELFLSEHLDEYDYREVIERILARNDLNGQITRDALLAKAKILLKEKDFAAAERIAGRILSIEKNANAHWIKWVALKSKGDDAEAERELSAAKEAMPEEVYRGFVALGWVCLGEQARAIEVIETSRSAGRHVAIIDRRLAELVRDNIDDSI